MNTEDNKDSICELRALNREELSCFREKNRENLLTQRRFNLKDVAEQIGDLEPEQFKLLMNKITIKKPALEDLKRLKNSLCTSKYIEDFFRSENSFNTLVQVLTGKDGQKQIEAAASLTNLACGSHKASMKIAKAAGAYLVSFTAGGNVYLQEQCAWAAANVAGDCSECFSILKAQGIIPAVMSILKSHSSGVVESAVYAVQACTKYGDTALTGMLTVETFNILFDIIEDESNSQSIVVDAALSVANLLYLAVLVKHIVIMEITAKLVLSCIRKETSKDKLNVLILSPLIRCLGYLTYWDEPCLYLLLESSFFPCLKRALEVESPCVKKEVLWVLTNVSVSGSFRSDVEPDLVFEITRILLNPLDKSVLQVLYFLCILATKSCKMRDMFQEQGTISYVKSFLSCANSDLVKASEVFLQIASGS